MTTSQIAKLAEMQAKKTLLSEPEQVKSTAREVVEAVACLSLGLVSLYFIMVVGTVAGL